MSFFITPLRGVFVLVFVLSHFVRTPSVFAGGSPEEDLEDLVNELESASIQDRQFLPSFVKEELKKKELVVQRSKAPAIIPYRKDGAGKGAFYDHYTFQRLTQHGTLMDGSAAELVKLRDYAKTLSFELPVGAKDTESGINIPKTADQALDTEGLLIIPGRVRADEYEQERANKENALIKKAKLRGQPILALCAGSWRLWESYGGKLVEVKDHCYGGGMIRLGSEGRVIYNVQIHGVKVNPNSFLAGILGFKSEENLPDASTHSLMVNSVHWKAPDAIQTPKDLIVCATATEMPGITIKNRQSEVMKPDSGTVEGFESQFGAPVLGVQWHPEGYSPDDNKKHNDRNSEFFKPESHIHILCKMAKAGDAYAIKRAMLKELSSLIGLSRSVP